MKKKTKLILAIAIPISFFIIGLSVLITLLAINNTGKYIVVNDYMLYLKKKNATITSYRGDRNTDTIDLNQLASSKYIITTIEEGVFQDLENLNTIYLLDTINLVKANAFANCCNLENIYQGNNKLNIYTFTNDDNTSFCSNLDTITFYNNALLNNKLPNIIIHNDEIDTKENHDSSENDTNVKLEAFNLIPNSEYSLKLKNSINSNSIEFIAPTLSFTTDSNGSYNSNIDFQSYGTFNYVEINLFSKNINYGKVIGGGISVNSYEYNIATLGASYPLLIFALSLKDITNSGKIPTFIGLDRYWQYDFNNLPYNSEQFPNLSLSQGTNENITLYLQDISNYVKNLYEINKGSKFNFFFADNRSYSIIDVIVRAGIPIEQTNITLLSDGSLTAVSLVRVFSKPNPYEILTDVMSKTKKIIDDLYVEFNSEFMDELIKNFDLDAYFYIFYKLYPNNVTFWANRLRASENLSEINKIDTMFAKQIEADSLKNGEKNANTLLTDLKTNFPDDLSKFKLLYRFNEDEIFKYAEENNKQIITILGAHFYNEVDFKSYVKTIVAMYGIEKYAFYYKPHPGFPLSTTPERKQSIDELNNEGFIINEIEASIPAEVLYFFKPTIYFTGYSSSTFQSVDDEHTLGIFNDNINGTSIVSYKYNIQFFINKLIDIQTYTSKGISLDINGEYMIIDYNKLYNYDPNTSPVDYSSDIYNKHEIAIYDVTNNVIKYYKFDSILNIYSEVSK